MLRQKSELMEMDKDMLKIGSEVLVQVEENVQGLPPRGEVCDENMNGKRSPSTMDGDREPKRTLSFSNAYGFRKSGRLPSKKLSDHETFSGQGHALSSGSSHFTGKADDDWKELLAAANYAPNANYPACSSPFWKEIEPFFGPISLEDTTYLHQQLTSLEKLDERFCHLFGTNRNVQDELVGKEVTLSQTNAPREREGTQLSEIGSNKLSRTVGSSDQSLYQRVLSAFIEEVDDNGEGSLASFEQASDNSLSGATCIQKLVDGIPVNGYEYQNMCLDDRIALELQSIGVYPEKVTYTTDVKEEIDNNVVELEKGLYQQAKKKKGMLGKLWTAVQKGREAEERNLEQIAMNKLVMMAYFKYSRVISQKRRGRKSSRGRVSKGSIEDILAFVKRTLERCQKFEETGRSCFSEPPLRDIILSAPRHSRPDSRTSAVGVASTVIELHDPHRDRHKGNSSDAFQGFSHSSDLAIANPKPKCNRWKKDVVLGDGASGVSPALGNSILSEAKGSEKPRDQIKDESMRSYVAKAKSDHLTFGSSRDERKTKMKSKRNTRSSTSENGLLGGLTVTTHPVCPSVHDSSGTETIISNKQSEEMELQSANNDLQGSSSKESEKPIDSTNLDINALESVELGITHVFGGHQDFSSWLNFDEAGLQEHDSMGLEIPMDSLSDLDLNF